MPVPFITCTLLLPVVGGIFVAVTVVSPSRSTVQQRIRLQSHLTVRLKYIDIKKCFSWWSHKHSLCFRRRTERHRNALDKQTEETRFYVQTKMRISRLLFSLLQLTASSLQFRKREKEQDTRVPASLAWHASLPSCRVNYESRATVRSLPVLFLSPKSESSQSNLKTDQWFGFTGVIRGISIRYCTG